MALACATLLGQAAPAGRLPPNTVPLSEMMRELSARPGFTEAFLKEVEGGSTHKGGAALLTPALIDHLRGLIVGKNWHGLDHFPGWTMARINPTVRVIGHVAGKDEAVKNSATAGGRPADASATAFLDLGHYALDRDEPIDLRQPSTLPGFDRKALMADLGDEVTRGDGPSELAAEHAESQRLAEVLNRLAMNGMDGVQPRSVVWSDTSKPTSPEELLAAIMESGHAVSVTDTRYFANFGHLHFKGQDVEMPFYVDAEIRVPDTNRSLLVPVSHAEYEWRIRGLRMNADVSFYFGIDGKAQFRTMDQQDQAWVMKRDAHVYTGAEAVEVTRLSSAIVRAYTRLHAKHPAIPFGGYYAFGVCQDVVAAVELKMTGRATLFPNTADERFFDDPRDEEINALIKRLPKDRAGSPPDVERIFGSLPVGSTDVELRTIAVPGLADDLIAVHAAWTAGKLKRTDLGWRSPMRIIGAALVLVAFGGLIVWTRRRQPRA